mgnify:CR=1 FL=1
MANRRYSIANVALRHAYGRILNRGDGIENERKTVKRCIDRSRNVGYSAPIWMEPGESQASQYQEEQGHQFMDAGPVLRP